MSAVRLPQSIVNQLMQLAQKTPKVLLGIGQTLAGRLLLFDALNMEWREIRLRKDPLCPVCGEI
jgi:adenylyltransferase/sulfurtransferase